MNVYFWMVSFRHGDTAADLESLSSWVEDNRRIFKMATNLNYYFVLKFRFNHRFSMFSDAF